MKRVPLIRQMGQHECGPACLSMILSFYNCKVSLNKISEQCGAQRNGVSIKKLKEVANHYGMDCKVFQVDAEAFIKNTTPYTPCILFWDNHHFVVLEKFNGQQFFILDPNMGRIKMNIDEFKQHFSNVILTFKPTNKLKEMSPPSTLEYYYRYISKCKSIVTMILIFSLIAQALSLLVAFVIKYLVDDIFIEDSYTDLSTVGICTLLGLVILSILMFIRSHFSIMLQAQISRDISTDFMEHLLKLPLSFFENRTVGDIAMRVSNIAMIREMLARSGTSIVLDIITLVTFFVAMLSQSVKLALFAIGLATFQFIFMVIFIPKIKELIRGDLSAQTTTQSFLIESLRSISFIKSNGLDHSIMNKWSRYYDKQINMFKKRYTLDAILESVSVSIRFCAPLLLLLFGIGEVSKGNLSLGGLLGFSSLGTAFLLPVTSIINSIQQFQLVGDVFERIQDVMETPAEEFNHEPLPDDLDKRDIILENVTFSHNQSKPVLQNINLKIPCGSKVALVGRTGSGKTTLSRIILGLYKPTSGTVYIGNDNLNSLNIYQLRRKLGVVLQESFLFNDTIANNISGFRKFSNEEIVEAAKKVRLHDDILQMPMGYETIIGENGDMLSGGQRQRLAIARAIVNNPSIVILDEATSNLDTLTENQIDTYFNESNTTRIIITHRLINTIDADIIVVLEQGQIIEVGKHSDLLSKKGTYQRMWEKQVGSDNLLVSS
ncbi:peptidase domain-containing ABC transporter [Bacillus xiapuensis]|uniref:peptidase domain-containing ABC transporter n=1 Tax=Bacillus xiapuensis TaxID=2014075 RepID=UPI000C248935|nr:peptidase domain-containing ABC transporter [Bacillus xiapuensis]